MSDIDLFLTKYECLGTLTKDEAVKKLKETYTTQTGRIRITDFSWIARHFDEQGKQIWAGSHIDPEHAGEIILEWHQLMSDETHLWYYKVAA